LHPPAIPIDLCAVVVALVVPVLDVVDALRQQAFEEDVDELVVLADPAGSGHRRAAGPLPRRGGLHAGLVFAQVGVLLAEDVRDLGSRVRRWVSSQRDPSSSAMLPGNSRCADTSGRAERSSARNSIWSVKMLSRSQP
jgi:hypothetical protein